MAVYWLDGDVVRYPDTTDQIVELTNVTWAMYERIASSRGESAVPRLTYCDGTLELMSPGNPHETDKTKLARLFEAYLDHLRIPAEGAGSWTIKKKRKKRGAEADECYVLTRSSDLSKVTCPDLVIEVVYRPGGLNKLDIWKRLGAKEVWFWTWERKLIIYVRSGRAMIESKRSRLVPKVDPGLLLRCMDIDGQLAAVTALRRALRKRR